MVNLQNRSAQKELLDAEDIPFADIKICMQELNRVNTWLGGHKITLQGVKALYSSEDHFHVCEIGCGGGDNLRAIQKRYSTKPFRYTGIDMKKECVEYAAQQYPDLPAKWIANDYKKVMLPKKPDVIFSSLFCHHFTDVELVSMLDWMRNNSEKGFFINDLQRSPIAYYLIKWITRIFSGSYLVQHDACISVARSFTKKDWQVLLAQAGIAHYRIQWKWAFRYLIIFAK